MKAAQILLLLVLGLVVAAALSGCAALNGYNHARQIDETDKQHWSQVENQLQRRYDLIPNLVATVKGITQQEQDVFLGIAKAREAYFQQKTIPGKAEAATQVESALSRLLMLRETYPELRSNESFLKLQDELAGTENRISVERMRYNESVESLNKFVRTFPGSFYAGLAGVTAGEYFQVPDAAKTAPQVDFSKPATAPVEVPPPATSTPPAKSETPAETAEPATP